MLPCSNCIFETNNIIKPKPCENCKQYCFCKNDKICKFCIHIVGYIIKANNIKKYLTRYPCYCIQNKENYTFKCDECHYGCCKCNGNDILCDYCFEKEFNKIIDIGSDKDFLINFF